MPAGVSWKTYLSFSLAAGLSMLLGAQTVHRVYTPLADLEDFTKKFEEDQKLLKEVKSSMNKTES